MFAVIRLPAFPLQALFRLRPELRGEPTPLNLICAHRAQLSKPVLLLREFVQARCAELLADAPWPN